MTALSKNSKDSTIFLCEPAGAGAAALAVDVGQGRANLSNNVTYVSESPSARTAITCPRELSIVVNLTNTSSGVILSHGNAVSYGYRVRVNAGAIECAEAGALRVSVTLPGTAAGPRKFLILWSQRPSGASVISDVYVYNFTTTAWVFGTTTHAASAVSATDTLVIGGSFGGASLFSGGVSAYQVVRIGQRYVSGTEAAEDFVAETTPPAMTARRRTPLPTGPSDELRIADEGQLAGPSFLHALAATRNGDSRTVTALVNVTPPNPFVETNAYGPARYFRPAWDSSVYHLSTRYLWHAYASPKTNHARVRVHVRAYNSGGGSIATVYLRMYSVAGLPVGGPPQPFTYFKTATVAIAAPTSADGAWQDLGVVRLAKEATGLTYFALAFSIGLDSGGPLESATRLKVLGVTIEPFFRALDNPGNGDIDDNKGGL